MQQRDAAKREHEQDFLGRVSDRGQRVAREDRQRDLFRRQRVTQVVDLHRATNQDALRQSENEGHDGNARPTWARSARCASARSLAIPAYVLPGRLTIVSWESDGC